MTDLTETEIIEVNPSDKYRIGQTNPEGILICGARTVKNEDKHPCRTTQLFPNGRCSWHGGKSVSGPVAFTFQHGRYSKAMPSHFQDRYARFLQDPEMTGMRDEIAIYRARLEELLSVMDVDVANSTWHRFMIMWEDFRFSVAVGNTEDQQEIFARLTDFVAKADRNRTTWTEINKTVSILAKLTSDEHRKMMTNKHMVTTEQVLHLLTQMILETKEAVYKYVDPDTAKCIIQDVAATQTRLLGSPGSDRLPS